MKQLLLSRASLIYLGKSLHPVLARSHADGLLNVILQTIPHSKSTDLKTGRTSAEAGRAGSWGFGPDPLHVLTLFKRLTTVVRPPSLQNFCRRDVID
jgi:hypothetical protein